MMGMPRGPISPCLPNKFPLLGLETFSCLELDGQNCWLWSLIIFLIQRSLLSAVFIPHEDFTPQKYVHSSTWGSAEGGYPLCGGGPIRGVLSPPAGGSGVKPPKEKLPCKSIL
jgi:hypothetical protein